MFAVAMWHRKEKKLLLIRDRMGIKPLYYFCDGTILIFASEIKALLASGLFHPRLNQQAIWDYLTFRYIPGPKPFGTGIWKLPPGAFWSGHRVRTPRTHATGELTSFPARRTINLDQKTKGI